MNRRPPRSTPTDTLFPYTTLFRSWHPAMVDARNRAAQSRRFGGGMNALPASPPASVPADLPLSVSRGIGMTARQLETLAYIDAYQQASGGVSPSFEIGRAHV